MRRRLGALAAILLLAGCKVGPSYREPALLSGKTVPPALIEGANPAFQSDAGCRRTGWRLYDDALLNALVQKGLDPQHGPARGARQP